jgi:DNA recombination protein RmuC
VEILAAGLALACLALAAWAFVAERRAVRLAALLESERRAAAEKAPLVQELKDTFTALSTRALRENNDSFLQLARTSLEQTQQGAAADLESRRKEIAALVEPVRERLTRLDEHLRASDQEHASLRGHLRSVGDTQELLRAQTQSLVNALKSPNQRGRWGEVTLRNIVERSGMAEYCGDFTEKESSVDAQGRRAIPDMLVRLPGGSCIVIDSKVPIDAYLRASEEATEPAREQLLKEHARQVRDHIKSLSAKTYWAKFSPTPELVVMFLPGEPLLTAALQHDSTLFDFAADQRVIPASPLTLLALLRTVAASWQQQRLAESAEQVRALGSELYDRLAGMADAIQSVGLNLKQAAGAYDRFIGSLDNRVIVSARRFKELGVNGTKELPSLEPLHLEIRELRAPELRVPIQESLIEAEILPAGPDPASVEPV